MPRRVWIIGFFLLALVPAAYLAWTYRAMPQLGYYHDDSVYWVSAKSLAEGHGYRIQSLPGEPFETKYPPLFPAILSMVWKAAPGFPANLKLATLVEWFAFPLWLLSIWALLREYKFQRWEQIALVGVAALNPVATCFSFSLMPELFFTSLFALSLLLAERAVSRDSPGWLPLVAGIAGGLAYLTKSAAAPLLVTVPLCFLLTKQFRKAVFFACGMAPAMIAWQAWVATHLKRSWDLVALYYTDYVGFQIYNVPLADLPRVVWYNLDGYLMGIGKLLTFDVDPIGSKHLERVVAIAAIAGAIRLARRTRKLQYPLAAAGFSALLWIWHYPPDLRFVFPLYPLLLASLWTELGNVARALTLAWRKHTTSDRIAAAVGAAALAAFGGFIVFNSVHGEFWFVPQLIGDYQQRLESRRPAYDWLARNTPPDANVFAYDDPILFLYTGRRSCNIPIPPKMIYHNDQSGIEKLLLTAPAFAREHRLDYVLLTATDFYRDLKEDGAKPLTKAMKGDPRSREQFQRPGVTVYQLTR